jgi:hypothetical protein
MATGFRLIQIMVNNGSSIKTNGSSGGQIEALIWQLLGNGNDPEQNQWFVSAIHLNRH